jgi:hypothetical protein
MEERFQDHLVNLERNQRPPPSSAGLGDSRVDCVGPGEFVTTEAALAIPLAKSNVTEISV